MKRLFAILLGIAACAVLAYQPESSGFASRYQYELFRSWQEKGGLGTSRPAQISRDVIHMDYMTRTSDIVPVEFDLSGGKIFNAREVLDLPGANSDLEAAGRLAGSFLYRFNTAIQRACFDYADMVKLTVDFNEQHGTDAIEALWHEYGNARLPVESISVHADNGLAVFSLSLPESQSVSLTVPYTGKMPIVSEPARTIESPIAPPAPVITSVPELPRSIPEPPKEATPEPIMATEPSAVEITPLPTELPPIIEHPAAPEMTLSEILASIDGLESRMNETEESLVFAHDPYEGQPPSAARSLRNYIFREYKVRRTLRNPYIANLATTLGTNFPTARVRHDGTTWSVDRPPLYDMFGGNLRLRGNASGTGIVVKPDPSCTVDNGDFVLPGGERVDGGNLSPEDMAEIAPFLPGIVYEHRAIGTDVLHHLVQPDGVQSTLVFKGIQRELFDFPSYAQMLLVLNDWWKGRPVYCRLSGFRKINEHVEFHVEIAVPYPDSSRIDFADARFHLDKDNRIDLVMLFLHPDVATSTP